MTLILGIDPGTRITGYAALDATTFKFQEYGVIKSKGSDKNAIDRMMRISEKYLDLLYNFQPDAIALETPFIGKYGGSGLALGQLRGALIYISTLKQTKIHDYSPSEVKMAVRCKGNAKKWEVRLYLSKILKIKVPEKPEDIGDAMAVAYACAMKEF